ncbi:MAG: undecaprenyl-phosphate galactose phosphotransferase WbaP [Burkholderiales bacterium]|nr:undecaprenyl-phosphate galactose phosphotransferase WbaP [Burkholderiales bacterium]
MTKTNLQRLALIISDLFSMAMAFLIAIAITQVYHLDLLDSPWSNFFHFGASKVLGLTIIALFWYQEQYIKRRPFWEDLLQIYRTLSFLLLINLGLSFVLAKGSLKILIVSFWLSFAIILPLVRIITKLLLNQLHLWQREVFILGVGPSADNAYQILIQNKMMGYRLNAFVRISDQDKNIPSLTLGKHQIINQLELIAQLRKNQECEIIVALTQSELNQQIGLINFLQHNALAVLVLPEISGLALYGAQIEHFFGNDQLVLRLNNNLARNANAWIKRSFDLICVSLGLIILSPLFVLIAIIIKYTTKSNVFFKHQRIGRNSKPFYCIKFQTMYPNSKELLANILATDPQACEEWERDFKLKDDPRVTKIGKFLRKTSLDELPQLFNVLLGEMSLVGPRPIISQEIERYADGFYYYQLVTPGITGLWQVSGRNDIDYTNRVRLDEWYVKNWSLWYDIVILVKTFGVVFKRSGAY